MGGVSIAEQTSTTYSTRALFTTQTTAKVELGRKLFFDQRLSASGKISCANCHDPKKAFSDGLAKSVGHDGRIGARNTPSLLASARMSRWSWDGRRETLEQQVLDPFFSRSEHALSGEAQLIILISEQIEYRQMFIQAFGKDEISASQAAAALVSYLQAMKQSRSRFDMLQSTNQLTTAQQRGFQLFKGRAGCVNCHTIDSTGSFSDGRFHLGYRGAPPMNEGILALMNQLRLRTQTQLYIRSTTDQRISSLGAFVTTLDPADVGKFRTPSLRNVALTAPYMHDGGVSQLKTAIALEANLRVAHLVLSTNEIDDVEVFLHTLSDVNAAQLE